MRKCRIVSAPGGAVLVALLLLSCIADFGSAPYVDDSCDRLSIDQLSLGTARADWQIASKPAQLDDSYSAGKLLWHNTLNVVSVSDVYDREVGQGEGVIRPFRLIFRPNAAGPSYGGIIRAFSSGVIADQIPTLEMRVRGTHGRVHFDFGRINEDLNGNGLADRESWNGSPYITAETDFGLDGLPDSLEYCHRPIGDSASCGGYDSITNPDPSGDNWFLLGMGKCPVPADQCTELAAKQEAAREGDRRYDSLYYEWLNGTEGNLDDSASGGKADREPLTQNFFNTRDEYFSYSIDLSSDRFLVAGSENSYNWKTFRIPLLDSLALDTIVASGSDYTRPDWSRITHLRVWFESGGGQVPDTVEIADWSVSFEPDDLRDTINCPQGLWDLPIEISHYYVRDYQYAKGRIYDLGPDTSFAPGDSIKTALIYHWDRDGVNSSSRECRLLVDPKDTTYRQDRQESLGMIPLSQWDYQVFDEPIGNRHYVMFIASDYDSLALGMYLEIKREDGNIDTIGSLTGDTLVLKTLRHSKSFNTPSSEPWRYLWRNVYVILWGWPNNFYNLSIRKGLAGTEPDTNNLNYQESNGQIDGTYLGILGLDQFNAMGEPKPDNVIDFHWTYYGYNFGLLVTFPSRHPFDTDTTYGPAGNSLPPLAIRQPNIYFYDSPDEQAASSMYYLDYEYKRRRPILELPCTQLEANCLPVYLNGRRLVADTDYTIDYERGLLYLMSEETLDPNALLQVDFGN